MMHALRFLLFVFVALTLSSGQASATCYQNYTVVSGDSCSTIATKTNVTVATIEALNPAINSKCTNLAVGQILCVQNISCAQWYTVVSGDTCSSIATKTSSVQATIIALNPTVINSACSNLLIGERICVKPGPSSASTNTSLSTIYSAWHCGSGDCEWLSTPALTTASWILNSGNGNPTFNIIIFSFMDPLSLLNASTNSQYLNGVPRGMNAASVAYFTSQGIRVMFSIGGAAWAARFSEALEMNATQLAINAAAAAQAYGVGIEIDYEDTSTSYLGLLDTFVSAYRSVIPQDASAYAPTATLLSVDLGPGTSYLTTLATHARSWAAAGLVNWANAMVADPPLTTISTCTTYWQQHLSAGLAADNLIVSLDTSVTCNNATLVQETTAWANTKSTRGVSFWAAGPGYSDNCTALQQESITYL